jgi:hypothetical protein
MYHAGKNQALSHSVLLQCELRQGWIYRGMHRGAHPCWPWSTGVQKNQIQKYGTISKSFPFLKSNWSSQFSAHIAENGISSGVLIFTIFWGHTPGPPRELAPSALESLGSQFIWMLSHHPLNNYKETLSCSLSTSLEKPCWIHPWTTLMHIYDMARNTYCRLLSEKIVLNNRTQTCHNN